MSTNRVVHVYRLCGIHIIQDEEPAWFPAEELREYHAVIPHKVRSPSLPRCTFAFRGLATREVTYLWQLFPDSEQFSIYTLFLSILIHMWSSHFFTRLRNWTIVHLTPRYNWKVLVPWQTGGLLPIPTMYIKRLAWLQLVKLKCIFIFCSKKKKKGGGMYKSSRLTCINLLFAGDAGGEEVVLHSRGRQWGSVLSHRRPTTGERLGQPPKSRWRHCLHAAKSQVINYYYCYNNTNVTTVRRSRHQCYYYYYLLWNVTQCRHGHNAATNDDIIY